LVGNHDDLRRPGHHVDGYLAEDMTFGERHEKVAGADDHVDRWNPFHAVSQRCDSLRPANAIDLLNPQFLARGKNIAIIRSEWCRRHNDGQLLNTGSLGRTDSHQQSRRVSRGTSRHTDTDAPHRPIAQTQLMATGNVEDSISVQDAELKGKNIL